MIQEYLKKAVYFENRGYPDQARQYYNKLIEHESLLDDKALEKLAQFFFSQEAYSEALRYARLTIEKQGQLGRIVPLYMAAWEKGEGHVAELEWLLAQPGIDYLYEERLRIARHLFERGRQETSYLLSLKMMEQIEQECRGNSSMFDLYIDILLHLVEIEYGYTNLTQCRFHIRKVIYLQADKLRRHQDIAYWSIIVDEVADFVTRSDWHLIERELYGPVLVICQFYQALTSGSIEYRFQQNMESARFADLRLEHKRKACLLLLQQMQNPQETPSTLSEQHRLFPHDLLTSLLYVETLEDTEEKKAFWRREFRKHADRPEAVKACWHAFAKEVQPVEKQAIENCQITFLGGGEKIGGTSILISVNEHHILLDAGMHLHEETYYPDYSKLDELGIGFQEVDALLLTHAHLDHVGAAPYVMRVHPTLPVFATQATKELMRILLNDTVKMGKHGDISADMYGEEEVQHLFLSTQAIAYNQPFMVSSKDSAWKVTYLPSGHILGAGAIHLEIEGISILFTGDYSIEDQRTVKGLQIPSGLQVDVLITESTYGFLPTNASMGRRQQERLFIEAVEHTMSKQGSMLIPAFALGRAQEIVLILKEAYKADRYLPFNLFLDGRVTEVCRIYQKFAEQKKFINPIYYRDEEEEELFFGNGVQVAQDIYSNRKDTAYSFQDFFEDYISPGKNCIVASSGMLLNDSASARYASYLVEEERNAITFTGYMDEESPGYGLLKKRLTHGEKVKINDQEKEVHARIESFRLSAHASREEIVQLILELQPKYVFLMHGEHQKRYTPIDTTVNGEVIYPTLIELLKPIEKDMKIIPAFNGTIYSLATYKGE